MTAADPDDGVGRLARLQPTLLLVQSGRQHSPRRAFIGPIVLTVGVAIAITGSFVRWLRSGEVGRTSYELLGLIHRLGFAPNGLARLLVRFWPVMPLLLVAGVVAVWWGWRVFGAVVAIFGAIFAGAIGAVVAFATPDTRGVQLTNGPAMTATGAAIAVVGSVLVLVLRPVVVRPSYSADEAHLGGSPVGPS